MKFLISVVLGLVAGPALAHPSHLIEVAGHNHWLGLAAIAAAVAAALLQAKKGRDEEGEAEAGAEDEAETKSQEA